MASESLVSDSESQASDPSPPTTPFINFISDDGTQRLIEDPARAGEKAHALQSDSATLSSNQASPIWSPVPQTLGQRRLLHWSGLIAHIFLTFLPLTFMGTTTGFLDSSFTAPVRHFEPRFHKTLGHSLTVFVIIRSQLVLAILAVRLDGEPISAFGNNVREATRLSPTIYPIVFAAVASRFYRSLARCQVELYRGIRLSVLEQLLGSQSFAGAVERLLFEGFMFAKGTWIFGLLILLSWAMSPVGGQSSSRLLYIAELQTTGNETVWFSNTMHQRSLGSGSSLGQQGDRQGHEEIIGAIYAASLLSSPLQKRSASDMWDRPKIPQWPAPALGTMEGGNQPDLDGNGWRNINQDRLLSGEDHYSSLIGIKLLGLTIKDPTVTYTFTVENMYIESRCVPFERLLSPSNATGRLQRSPWSHFNVTKFCDSGSKEGMTSFGVAFGKAHKSTLSYERISWDMLYATKERTEASNHNNGNKTGGRLTYRDTSNTPAFLISLFNCSLHTVDVWTQMRCEPGRGTGCVATKQRRLVLPGDPRADLHPDGDPGRWSPYGMDDTEAAWPSVAVPRDRIEDSWPQAAGQTPASASPTEHFIEGDANPYKGSDWQKFNVSTPKRLDDFSRRLTTAFNTYWQARLDPLNITDVSTTFMPHMDVGKDGAKSLPPGINPSFATVTTTRESYRYSTPWVAVLVFATMVLQLMAFAGLALKLNVAGPDLFGYVSSLTRDSPHVPVPEGGTGMSGRERTRKFGDVRLQLVDLKPGEEVGYIALRALPSPGLSSPGLSSPGLSSPGLSSPGLDSAGLDIHSEGRIDGSVKWRALQENRLYA